MADKTTKPTASNTWIIGVVLIILVLGGAGLYQMKLKKDLQKELDQKVEKGKKKTNKNTLEGDDEDTDEEPEHDGKSLS